MSALPCQRVRLGLAKVAVVLVSVGLGVACAARTAPPGLAPADVTTLEADVAAHPTDPTRQLRLAKADYAAGRFGDARQALGSVLAMQPLNREAQVYLGYAYEGLTQSDSARAVYTALLAFRQWSPADYRGGGLKSGGLVARAGLTDRLAAAVSGRYDDGWILARGRGFAFVKGYDATLFLRNER